ncbi:MAG: cyclic nucleotide-binding domain-containing protein [Phycisphaerae bacterium]|nr:cyclic nucleotide-binding domain-containing protein [Phycisphaerae bacterium]
MPDGSAAPRGSPGGSPSGRPPEPDTVFGYQRGMPGPDPAARPADAGSDEDLLAQINLFARLDDDERRALRASMKVEAVAANQTIFWLGDKGDAFYLIREGEVAITVPNEQGEHVTLNTLGPGGFFGEISLLDGGPRTATVRALTRCVLLVLTRDALQGFLRKRPDVALDILTVMGQRQRVSTEALRNLKNPNQVFAQQNASLWQRASDVIAAVAASQWFTIFHLAWFGIWISTNILGPLLLLGVVVVPDNRLAELPFWVFDPFPFGLLTMVVSLEAIFLSIFVMVSQNRQSEKDRLRTDLDYQVNVKAQTEIVNIARRLEALERIEEKVQTALERLDNKPGEPGSPA